MGVTAGESIKSTINYAVQDNVNGIALRFLKTIPFWQMAPMTLEKITSIHRGESQLNKASESAPLMLFY